MWQKDRKDALRVQKSVIESYFSKEEKNKRKTTNKPFIS